MDPKTRAALERALETVPDELRTARAGCRELRRAILAHWPQATPRPTRVQLVDGVRSIRRAAALEHAATERRAAA